MLQISTVIICGSGTSQVGSQRRTSSASDSKRVAGVEEGLLKDRTMGGGKV